MAPAARPVRLLCLHGTCSSGAIMKKQLSRMQPLIKGQLELIFVDGPLKSADDNPMREAQERFWKGMDFWDWCRWVNNKEGQAAQAQFWSELYQKYPNQDELFAYLDSNRELHFEKTEERQYEDLDEALEYLQDKLHQHRPIDGVLGFSQGANMANLLAAQSEAGHGASLSFAIHICPGRPGWVKQRPRLYRDLLPMRSLHISGRKDQNPPFSLSTLYKAPVCFMHMDGHRPVPGTSAEEANLVVRAIIDFALGRPLDLPPQPVPVRPAVAPAPVAAKTAAPVPTAPKPVAPAAAAAPSAPPSRELHVVVNVDKELGVVFELDVARGTTIFGLKELIALQDPTSGLAADTLALKSKGLVLTDDQVVAEDWGELDLCEQ